MARFKFRPHIECKQTTLPATADNVNIFLTKRCDNNAAGFDSCIGQLRGGGGIAPTTIGLD